MISWCVPGWRMTYHEDDDTAESPGLDDREGLDASDTDDPDDDAGETVPCPWCRKPVYEGAERCPRCGRYLSEQDAPRRYPWWLIAGVVLCLLVILLFWIR
jgi:hypothetical protein